MALEFARLKPGMTVVPERVHLNADGSIVEEPASAAADNATQQTDGG